MALSSILVGSSGCSCEEAGDADSGPGPDAGSNASPDARTDAEPGLDSGADAGREGDSGPGPGTTIVASPDGSGDECTLEAPCSLIGARDKVRALNDAMSADLEVLLRGGRYELAAPLSLSGEDSGSNGHAVVWRAHGEELPVLSGGVLVTGWALDDPVKGIYRAETPHRFRQLYVNGVRAYRARTPRNPEGLVLQPDSGYTLADDTMSSWRRPEDLEVVDLIEWRSYRCGVEAIDGRELTVDGLCWDAARFREDLPMGLPDWLENAYELLDLPGEFYLDDQEGAVYYIPRSGEDLATAEVISPVLETLVAGIGIAGQPLHDLQLRGITFADATWLGPDEPSGYASWQAGYHLTDASWESAAASPGNLTFEFAHGLVIADNRLTRLGTYALHLGDGCRDVTIEGNELRDLSGGGIQVGEQERPYPNEDEMIERIAIRNNYVTETGREYHDQHAIFVVYARDTTIEHNEVHNASFGISLGWGWGWPDPTVAERNRISANLVHHVLGYVRDGGLVYTLGAQPDSVIERNYLHDQLNEYGTIYLDAGSSSFSVTDNVVSSSPAWFLLQTDGSYAARENELVHNYTDTERVHCGVEPAACLELNTVEDTVLVAGDDWPEEAVAIMDEAGLEPGFEHLGGTARRLEAEDFRFGGEGITYHDRSAGNGGLAYRGNIYPVEDVDVFWGFIGTLFSNDACVGGIEPDEWLTYTLDVPQDGTYALTFAVASIEEGGTIAVEVDGVAQGEAAVPDTGDYFVFAPAEGLDVVLSAGRHVLRLDFDGHLNLDYLTYELL